MNRLFSHTLVIGLFSLWARYPHSSPSSAWTRPVVSYQIAASPMAEMVLLKGDRFFMGDSLKDGFTDELPVHSVEVGSFWIDKFEITFELFDSFCIVTDRAKPADEGWGRDKYPVIHVTWYDAIRFCNWRSEQEGLQLCYSLEQINPANDPLAKPITVVTCNWAANGYRLPTEAEWEFAARKSNTQSRFANGSMIAAPEELNFDGSPAMQLPYVKTWIGRRQTVNIGSLPSAGNSGIYDMSGNVAEWCWDYYSATYYTSSKMMEPCGPSQGKMRCVRGGSWRDSAKGCRVSSRSYLNPLNKSNTCGFRCVRRSN